MTAPDSHRLADRLTITAWRAGRVIMSHFGRTRVELKADASPVTAADRESDALIVAELAALCPDIPIVSEESADAAPFQAARRFFLVDPLDGTKEFVSGRGEFTINIALIDDGEPVFGLVYAPAVSKLYVTLSPSHAVCGELNPAEEAEPNLAQIAGPPLKTRAPEPDGLVAAVSRTHLDERTRRFLAAHKIRDTVIGGSSIKFGLIAEGKADVYPRLGRTMEWDTAAGHAVLLAAGGVVLDETGGTLRYGKVERGMDNPGFVAWGRLPPAA